MKKSISIMTKITFFAYDAITKLERPDFASLIEIRQKLWPPLHRI